jgi:hypothetical protein
VLVWFRAVRSVVPRRATEALTASAEQRKRLVFSASADRFFHR